MRIAAMTKETITVRIEELQTIRLVYPSGLVHEMPLCELKRYADDLPDKLAELKKGLVTLADNLQFFSRRDVTPSVEFVMPVEHE
jgi:hypothetical protein